MFNIKIEFEIVDTPVCVNVLGVWTVEKRKANKGNLCAASV